MSIFLFLVHYQEAHTLNCLVDQKKSVKGLINIKTMTINDLLGVIPGI